MIVGVIVDINSFSATKNSDFVLILGFLSMKII